MIKVMSFQNHNSHQLLITFNQRTIVDARLATISPKCDRAVVGWNAGSPL
jgi:hypothetical protein